MVELAGSGIKIRSKDLSAAERKKIRKASKASASELEGLKGIMILRIAQGAEARNDNRSDNKSSKKAATCRRSKRNCFCACSI